MVKTQERVEQILQSCLDLILNHQETIDSVLEYFPDLEDELRPRLEAAVWISARKTVFDPRPGFVLASKQRLMVRIRQETAVTQPHGQYWILDFVRNLDWPKFAFQSAVILLLIVFLFVGLNGILQVAQNTLPGDPLYTVKTAEEKAQLVLTLNKAGDTQLYIQFAERRLKEIQALILTGNYEQIRGAVTRYEESVNLALDSLTTLAEGNHPKAGTLAVQLDIVFTQHATAVERLSETVSRETQSELAKVLEISQAGALALQTLDLPALSVPLLSPTPSPSQTPPLVPTATRTLTPVSTNTPSGTSGQTASQTPMGESSTAREPTDTPTPTEKVRPKPKNTHKPTPRPPNPNKPDKDKPNSPED